MRFAYWVSQRSRASRIIGILCVASLVASVLFRFFFGVDDAESTENIEAILGKSLSFYGTSEVHFSGCELRIRRQTGSSCLNSSSRKSIDIVFDFSEFSHFLEVPPVGGTTDFILFYNRKSLDVVEAAQLMLKEPSIKSTDRSRTISEYLLSELSSGTVARSCSGDLEYLSGLSNGVSLFINEDSSELVSNWLAQRIEACNGN